MDQMNNNVPVFLANRKTLARALAETCYIGVVNRAKLASRAKELHSEACPSVAS